MCSQKKAQKIFALEHISLLQSEIQVVQEPTDYDNTYIYAINDVARQSWDIAKDDPVVKEIWGRIKGTAVTIAAIQPTAFVSQDGKVTHSGQGQVMITSNWQLVDGRRYIGSSFASLDGKSGESYQRIWNVRVDLGQQKVAGVTTEQDRVMKRILATNIIYSGMNMYMPDVVETKSKPTVRWINDSAVPHNVVGTFVTSSGEIKANSGFSRVENHGLTLLMRKGCLTTTAPYTQKKE